MGRLVTIITYLNYGSTVRSDYRYNGLNWRIEKTADVGPGGVPDGAFDQKRSMYYSADWQLLEEHIDDDTDAMTPDGVDRHMQYVWGPRYLDDIVLRRLDADSNTNATIVVNS
jgi:hypothetical protein